MTLEKYNSIPNLFIEELLNCRWEAYSFDRIKLTEMHLESTAHAKITWPFISTNSTWMPFGERITKPKNTSRTYDVDDETANGVRI